jgi:hypothetical protein
MDAPFVVKPVPSTSAKQEKFMRAVANSPKFSKKVGVPQSVGKEFEMKDKEGKMMKKEGRGMAKADLQKHASMPASKAHAGLKKGGMAKLTKSEMASKMGKVKTSKPSMGSASKRADGVAMKGKTKGVMMKKGGMCK